MTIRIKLFGAIYMVATGLLSLNAVHACADYTILASEIAGSSMITKTAIATGNYRVGSTWSGGVAPGVNDVVKIPPGITVTIDDTTAVAKTILVSGSSTRTGTGTGTQQTGITMGTLQFAPGVNSTLRVETILVGDYGRLLIGGYNVGSEGGPIASNKTANIVFTATGANPVGDSQVMARGLITDCDAIVRMNSASARAPFVELAGDVDPSNIASSQSVAINNTFATTNWAVGDEVVIPSTIFTREWSSNMVASKDTATAATTGTEAMQNEVRTLGSVSAGSISLTAGLVYSHTRADTSSRVHVNAANLTRNIIVQSDPTNGLSIATRGHCMFMGGDVKINGVRFQDLGRTNKREVVSDPLLSNEWNAPALNIVGNYSPNFLKVPNSGGVDQLFPLGNARARYSVHFHENMENFAENRKEFPLIYTTAPKAVVSNSVVEGSPGFGFVNHSSWVDYTNNVCFDFRGSGFVAEDGDELGTFSGNIAIGGLGNGEFPLIETVSSNRPRTNQGDMGFTGEGFWTQGVDVKFINNIAAGCKGCGYLVWGAGRLDQSITATYNHVIGTTQPGPVPYQAAFTGRPLGRDSVGGSPITWIGDSNTANLNAVNPNNGNPVLARALSYSIDPTPTRSPDDVATLQASKASATRDVTLIADVPPQDFTGNIAYGCFMGIKHRFANNGSLPIYNLRGRSYDNQFMANVNGQLYNRGKYLISGCTFWNNLLGIMASYTENEHIDDVYIVAHNVYRTTDAPVGAADAGMGYKGIFLTASHGFTVDNINTVTVKNYTESSDALVSTEASKLLIIASGVPPNANGNIFHTVLASDNVPDYGQR